MIDKTKSKIANLLLKNKLAKVKRKIKSFGLNNAKQVGIIYHFNSALQDEEVRSFARFLKEERINVETLCYISSKEQIDKVKSELTYKYFNKKELNWLQLPQKKDCLRFISKEFDILIDLSTKTYLPIKYITSLSKAHFKVGESSAYKTEQCDLTIDISKNKTQTYLIEQVKHYLSLIH